MNGGAKGGLDVRPLPGTGVLVRLGDLVLACATTGAQELVRITTEVYEQGGDGRELSRRLMRWALDQESTEPPACAMLGPTGDGRIALLAYGTAAIVGTADGTAFAVTGADSEHPVTRLVSGNVGLVQVRLAGSTVAEPLLRLDGGVIRAGGAEVTGFVPGSGVDRAIAAGYPTGPMPSPGADEGAPLLPTAGAAPGLQRALPGGDLPRRVPAVPGDEPVRYGGLSADAVAQAPSEPKLIPTQPMEPTFTESFPADPPGVVVEQLRLAGGRQTPTGGVAGHASVPFAAGGPATTPAADPQAGVPLSGQPAEGQPGPQVAGQPGPQVAGQPGPQVAGQPGPQVAGPAQAGLAQPAGGTDHRPGTAQPAARGGGLAAVLRERTRYQQPVPGAAPTSASALRFPDREAAYQAVLLVEGSVTENSLPPTPAQPAVMVEGVACVRDHLNPPGTQWCHVCSADIPPAAQLRSGPRPALGILVLDNAMSFVLDADYVAGREPQIDRDVAAGQARPLLVTDPEGIVSRRHIRVHLDGWRVSLIDLGSANGTQVQRPGRPHPETVPRGSSVPIEPGTEIVLGPRRLRFEAHSLVNIGS